MDEVGVYLQGNTKKSGMFGFHRRHPQCMDMSITRPGPLNIQNLQHTKLGNVAQGELQNQLSLGTLKWEMRCLFLSDRNSYILNIKGEMVVKLFPLTIRRVLQLNELPEGKPQKELNLEFLQSDYHLHQVAYKEQLFGSFGKDKVSVSPVETCLFPKSVLYIDNKTPSQCLQKCQENRTFLMPSPILCLY